MDRLTGKLLDLLWYAVAVTVAATAVGFLVALTTGGGLVPVKYALFFIGFGLFGYASIVLWRSPSLDPDDGAGIDDPLRDRTPFESFLARVAPAVDEAVAPEERLSPPVKLFVASLLVLGFSLGMETLIGVE